MALEDYRSDTMLSINVLPELYCSFTIYRANDYLTPPGTVRLYIDIDHDLTFSHIECQNTIDLTYTEAEYAMLLREQMLVENIKMHYLMTESMHRSLDEYFH